DEAENFRLVEAPVAEPRRENWREIVGDRADVRLLGVDAFAGHLVVHERAEAVTRLRVVRTADGETHAIDHPEAVHTVSPGLKLEFETDTFRFHYSSLVTPDQAVDYRLSERSQTVVKEQPVPDYDPGLYRTERQWATA